MSVSKKLKEKWRKQEIELHKRILKTWLKSSTNARLKTINKFFKLYDLYITPDNIENFLHLHSKVFINALVTNRLHLVASYYIKQTPKKKKYVSKKRKKPTSN